jgi:hypothetical protein
MSDHPALLGTPPEPGGEFYPIVKNSPLLSLGGVAPEATGWSVKSGPRIFKLTHYPCIS